MVDAKKEMKNKAFMRRIAAIGGAKKGITKVRGNSQYYSELSKKRLRKPKKKSKIAT